MVPGLFPVTAFFAKPIEPFGEAAGFQEVALQAPDRVEQQKAGLMGLRWVFPGFSNAFGVLESFATFRGHVVACDIMDYNGVVFPNGCSAAAHRSKDCGDPKGVPKSWKRDCVVPEGAGASPVKRKAPDVGTPLQLAKIQLY